MKDARSDADGVIRIDEEGGDVDDVDCQNAEFRRHGVHALMAFRRHFRPASRRGYLIEDGTTHVVYAFGSGPLYRSSSITNTIFYFNYQFF